MEKKDEITLIDAFEDFKEEKSIDRPVMMGVLKDVFLTQIAKTFGSADNFDVIINVDKGDCEIYQNFDIVEEVENPNTQITLDEILHRPERMTTRSVTSTPRNCPSHLSEEEAS